MTRLLIDAGADVNALDNHLDSPLFLAGVEDLLEILTSKFWPDRNSLASGQLVPVKTFQEIRE